jgi:hypothetical protein
MRGTPLVSERRSRAASSHQPREAERTEGVRDAADRCRCGPDLPRPAAVSGDVPVRVVADDRWPVGVARGRRSALRGAAGHGRAGVGLRFRPVRRAAPPRGGAGTPASPGLRRLAGGSRPWTPARPGSPNRRGTVTAPSWQIVAQSSSDSPRSSASSRSTSSDFLPATESSRSCSSSRSSSRDMPS